MSIYSRFILPRLVHYTCSRGPNMRQRGKIVPRASGRVLEVGFGSGLNLSYYNASSVTHLWALEPSPEMWALARPKAGSVPFPVDFLNASLETVPLPDHSVDTAVITYTLCTIPDVPTALAQLRRVLAPGGSLVFCEHGLAPDQPTRRWQARVNPLWRRFSGGCELNRDIPALLADGGFTNVDLATMYIPGWRPASFNYWGTAVPRK